MASNIENIKELYLIKDDIKITCGDFALLGSRFFSSSVVISSFTGAPNSGHSVLYDFKDTWDFYNNVRILNYRYPQPLGIDDVKEKIWDDAPMDIRSIDKFYSNKTLAIQNKIWITEVNYRDKMKVYCVRIGDKYGPEYEDYINEKLKKYEVIWIREPFGNDVKLQWNKMLPMSYDIDEPIVVIDIDIELINDYEMLFDYPINRGEFLSIPAWWKDSPGYNINGGFFKYYPRECNYIYEKFINNVEHWQDHYIDNGTTIGPVNGEQYFVEDSVNERLKLITVPSAWVARWTNGDGMSSEQHIKWQMEINDLYLDASGNDYLRLGEFHPDVKMVHYTHTHNKPIRINDK